MQHKAVRKCNVNSAQKKKSILSLNYVKISANEIRVVRIT
jgi:hypothetical protein